MDLLLNKLIMTMREKANPQKAPAMQPYMKHLFPFLELKKWNA